MKEAMRQNRKLPNKIKMRLKIIGWLAKKKRRQEKVAYDLENVYK